MPIRFLPMESDWRKFTAMVPLLRERYLAAHNQRFAALLTQRKKTETERFWQTLDKMKAEAGVLERCLNGHSRSKMEMFMAEMIACGLLTKAEITEFSPELQRHLEFAFERGLRRRSYP
jgi:hypothetical protein